MKNRYASKSFIPFSQNHKKGLVRLLQ